MRVVITGGTGYIGSPLPTILLASGLDVCVFDKLVYGGESLLAFGPHPRFQSLYGDVRDTGQLAVARGGVDHGRSRTGSVRSGRGVADLANMAWETREISRLAESSRRSGLRLKPRDRALRARRVELLLGTNDLAAAGEEIQELLSELTDAEAHQLMTALCIRRGDPSSAFRYCQDALGLHPQPARACRRLGMKLLPRAPVREALDLARVRRTA